MLQLRHRNIVSGYAAWVEGRHTACLAMEHCAGGELTAFLAARGREYIRESDVCIMLVQVQTTCRALPIDFGCVSLISHTSEVPEQLIRRDVRCILRATAQAPEIFCGAGGVSGRALAREQRVAP